MRVALSRVSALGSSEPSKVIPPSPVGTPQIINRALSLGDIQRFATGFKITNEVINVC